MMGHHGDVTDEVCDYAQAYAEAMLHQPHRATQAVADHFGVSRATALRRLNVARGRGLIQPLGEHRPATARWANSIAVGPPWLACVTCHMPWPCPESQHAAVVDDAPEPTAGA